MDNGAGCSGGAVGRDEGATIGDGGGLMASFLHQFDGGRRLAE